MNSHGSRPTILVDKYVNAANKTNEKGYNYKGLYIHTAPGLHDFVAGKIETVFAKGESMLDLAAGSGAMSLRLCDMGFNVRATDYVAENFRLSGDIEFIALDLNQDFSNNLEARFDGIIAMEIIEHLENPRHFFRECFRALNPGGRLVLTTPNIDNPVSKALFVRSSYFQWFSYRDYEDSGHITPLSQWQLGKCSDEAGFEKILYASFGDPFRHLDGWRNMRYLARMISRITSKEVEPGEIFMAIWRKPQEGQGDKHK